MKLSDRIEKTIDFTANDIFHLVSGGESWKVKTGVFFNNGMSAYDGGVGLGGVLVKDTNIQTDTFAFQVSKAANIRLVYNIGDIGDLNLLSNANNELYFQVFNSSAGALAQSTLNVFNDVQSGINLISTSTGNTNKAYLNFLGQDAIVRIDNGKALTFMSPTYTVGTMYNGKFGIGTFATPSTDIFSSMHIKGTLSIHNFTQSTDTDYNITNDNYLHFGTAVTVDRIINLPSIGVIGFGKIFVIRNSATSTKNLIVTLPADHGFDITPGGATTYTLLPNQSVTITSLYYGGSSGVYGVVSNGTDTTSFVTTSRTLNINGVTQTLAANREWRTAMADTGCLTFAGISVASGTEINLGAVTGVIANNETAPGAPTFVNVTYAGALNITVPTLGSGIATYVLVDNTGPTFQNTFPTSAQRKTKIYVAKIGHPAGVITTAGNEPDFITSPLAQFRDLFQSFNYVNTGVAATAIAASLTFSTSTGTITGNGINFVTDKTNPNTYTVASSGGLAQAFLPRTQTGAGGAAITIVDVANYDVAGVVTAIPGGGNVSTLRYVFYVPPLGYIIQYGQTTYTSLSAAIAAVGRENPVIYPSLVRNAILVGVIAATKSCTNLADTTQAQIFKADLFGQIIGASAGVSVATFQNTYINSLIPQITLTALGAITTRNSVTNGAGTDAAIVQQWQNIAGTTTASIHGDGSFIMGLTTKLARLTIRGEGATTSTDAFWVENSAGTFAFKVNNGGYVRCGNIELSNVTPVNTGNGIYAVGTSRTLVFSGVGGSSASALDSSRLRFEGTNANNLTQTSGTWNNYYFTTNNFAPTSGTAIFRGMTIDGTINQTGGANGITAGLRVDMTIAAAADFRAVDVITGKSHFRDLKLTTAGDGFYIKEGANATMGTAVLVGGTLVVNTTKVTATSRIYLTIQSLGTVAAPKSIAVTARVAATSFTITSEDVTDTSTIAWVIIEPS